MMFLSDEWHNLSFSRKLEGKAICRLVSYQESFQVAISKPLVKVLRLVDGDKLAMDRAKEAIRAYYDDKEDDRFEKRL
jgi:hypothetical protein